MNPILNIFLISMVPLIEQRGAIPVGIIGYHINPLTVALVSLMGSFIPAPFIYLFFNKILAWMKTIKLFDKFTNFMDKKIQKGSKKLEKYKEIGLISFVGIPLPTTGLWTGTAVAAFLGLDFKKSMVCVFLGGIISAILITIISVVAPALLGLHA
ncbi:MAG: small multi-drug export protein [Candidatus Shapirobacteria bacterium]